MNYGLIGATGKMGREIMNVFVDHSLVLAVDSKGEELHGTPHVVVDFSSRGALDRTLAICTRHKSALVLGTTALEDSDFIRLRKYGEVAPVVQSYNFAIGVNILKMILREYAPLFEDWDSEIVETHHNKKKDIPSGTAILLSEATQRDCPTHSLRVGGVPGDHVVLFGNNGEVVTFGHRALARNVFAIGALRAALFTLSAAPGFYTFEDVLKKTRS
ncbi:MAG: 4-hydroxy-tetrahydrodipicolinate reductase [Synergistaceae bacterium]|jgi:4-hydroxy-tetrahydrodipicolinate reductase|nr:4-hydroxy-tetrahydrodipicolinate reductase [Synergistaceae bacterium]